MALLRIEIHAPADMAHAASEVLLNDPYATNVTQHRGMLLDPEGDVLTCDVPREASATLLQQLEEAGLCDGAASIAVIPSISHISQRAALKEQAAPGTASDALVWPLIRDSLDEETDLSFTFLAFMCLAAVLASIGVVTDSAILIVGAMVLGPEFGPIASLSVAVIERAWKRVGHAWLTATIGFTVAFVVTIGFTALSVATGLFPSTAPGDGFVRDISNATTLTLVISIIAGIAGTLSITSSRSGALIGVLISITTIPALGDAAVLAVYGEWSAALGALGTLAVNLSGITIAAIGTLMLHRWLAQRRTLSSRAAR